MKRTPFEAYQYLKESSIEELSREEPDNLNKIKEESDKYSEEKIGGNSKSALIVKTLLTLSLVSFFVSAYFLSLLGTPSFYNFTYEEIQMFSIVFPLITVGSVIGVVFMIKEGLKIENYSEKIEKAILYKYNILEGMEFLDKQSKGKYTILVNQVISEVYGQDRGLEYNIIISKEETKSINNFIKNLNSSPREIKEKIGEEINYKVEMIN